jgi:hypothetical protein
VVSLGTPQARQPVQAGDAAIGLAATGCISAAQARRW